MKKKLSREFKIGFFGIAMAALLFWGINFIKGKDIFSSTNKYYAVYDQVNGLQASSPISIKGYKVGTISDISYNPRSSDNVIVEFSIKHKYKIPVNSKARIYSDGLLGGKAVEVQLGDSHEFLQKGDTLFSVTDKDFLEVAGSEFEFLKQKVNTVAVDVSNTLSTINSLLAENRGSIQTTLANTAMMSESLNDIISSEKGSLKQMVANMNALSSKLREKTGQIDNIINNVENFSDSLSQSQIPTTIAELSTTLRLLNQTIETINKGEGTVGKFINDKALYDELLSSSTNLSMLLEDLRTHPGRYLNISVFGRKNKD